MIYEDYDGDRLKDVAQALGLSRSHVDMIVRRAIRRLWRIQVNPRAAAAQSVRPPQGFNGLRITDAEMHAALDATDWHSSAAAKLLGCSPQAVNQRRKARSWMVP